MPGSRDIHLLDMRLAGRAARVALRGLDPRRAVRRPVLCVIEAAAAVVSILFVCVALGGDRAMAAFAGQIAAWLWLTVYIASFGEAVAEARGHARADRLRILQHEIRAKRLLLPHDKAATWLFETVSSRSLRLGEIVLVETGDIVPVDGEAIEGVAEVDESALTGESAPVIRESGGDRSAVIGGTRVVSDWLKVRVTARPDESFYDHIIRLIETARRHMARRELILTTPLVGLAVAVAMVATIARPFPAAFGGIETTTFVVALLTALLPTATAGLVSAIGLAGMDRLAEANVIAKSGAAVEAAGRVDTLLLDKTGTITLGGRTAEEFLPLGEVTSRELVEAAFLASQSDETPEGRSIVRLAETQFGLVSDPGRVATFIAFSAETRLSGARMSDGGEAYKGAPDAILRHLHAAEPPELKRIVDRIARSGGTPLAVSLDRRVIGVVHLKDTVRPGLRDRCAQLRRMGVRTVMVTGDNPLTAATVAAEAGVDDFVAEASPAAKVRLIRDEQRQGKLVGMCGDGTNDAPALAQADVGIALNLGSAVAREAGNMIDLDSDPLKLMEVIRAGRQLVTTRRVLTSFALASDAAKCLTVVLAVLAMSYPRLQALDVLGLATPQCTLLAANVFNVLVILVLLPLALRGVRLRWFSAAGPRWRDILVYALGGLVVTPLAISLIGRLVAALGLA